MQLEKVDVKSLSSMKLEERKLFPKIGVVYFVLIDSNIGYIGKAQNLRYRWRSHKLLREIEGNAKIAWLEIKDKRQRYWTERNLIEQHNPQFNIVDTPKIYARLAEKKKERTELKERRKQLGLSQQELANRLNGLAVSTVARWEQLKDEEIDNKLLEIALDAVEGQITSETAKK